MKATIYVDCRKKVGEISPLLYGGGFENAGGAVHLGLDAQMLDGENFQEEDVNQDGVSDKWLPFGYGDHSVRYSRDGRQFLSGSYSQRIEILSYRDGETGIKQGGLFLAKGKKYLASLHLLQNGMKRRTPVGVSLRKGARVFAEQNLANISSEWKKYAVALEPDGSSSDAEFSITVKGKGILWIDQVSLVPEDTYLGHGFRKDIMEAILSLRPTFIRWPGGWFSESYRWRDGIGPLDRRPVRRKYYSSVRAKNDPSWESNRFGTDGLIQFCRDIGAVPLLTVNIGYEEGADPKALIEEASSWVDYCNGKSTTPYGALREANGFPEPYAVKYWGIGNEPWEMDPAEYCQRIIRFARRMKEKDPTIELIGAGGYGYNSRWNDRVLRLAGPYIDHLDLHYYYTGDYPHAMAEPLKYERFLKHLKRRISTSAANKEMKLAILEWNSNTNLKDGSRLKDGLYAAGLLNVMERQSGLLSLCSPWPLLRRVQASSNHLSDHGLIRFDHRRVYLSPTGLAFKLYRDHFGSERLRCKVDCPAFRVEKRHEVPYLDVVATRNEKGGPIFLKVVNKSREKNIRTKIVLEGLHRVKLSATVSTLNARDPESENNLDHPDEVKIISKVITCDSDFEYSFPAHSATAIKL